MISEENRLRREEELDKEQVELTLRSNLKLVLWFVGVSFFAFHTIAVILPLFLVNSECGAGHNDWSHILFGVYTVLSLIGETALVFSTIIPYRRIPISQNSSSSGTRVWRRRLKEHLDQFGDVYVFLIAGCMCRFNLYADVLFLSISWVCENRLMALLALIFIGVNVFYRLLHFLSAFLYLLRQNGSSPRPFFVGEILCEIASSQDFLAVPYLLDFESVKIPPLGCCHFLQIPSGQSLAFLRLVVQNIPLFVIQLMFLGWGGEEVEQENISSSSE